MHVFLEEQEEVDVDVKNHFVIETNVMTRGDVKREGEAKKLTENAAKMENEIQKFIKFCSHV